MLAKCTQKNLNHSLVFTQSKLFEKSSIEVQKHTRKCKLLVTLSKNIDFENLQGRSVFQATTIFVILQKAHAN